MSVIRFSELSVTLLMAQILIVLLSKYLNKGYRYEYFFVVLFLVWGTRWHN